MEECEAEFDHDYNAVAFPRELLSRRVDANQRFSNRPTHANAALHNRPQQQASFAESLQRLLASRSSWTALPKLDEVSAMIGVSQRTIRRRLFNEGVTYRDVIDRIRFGVACEMLSETGMLVSEISLELGYSGPNNFVRAFKRLSGATPAEYRRNLSAE